MRLAGWFFLLAGLVLCLSVVWATVGLLLMGVGLIALRAAERQRQSSAAKPATPARATPLRGDAVSFDALPVAVASVDREPVLHEPALREPAFVPLKASETARWRELVESDPDISSLVAILTPHGAGYVEQFATDYLAVDDKAALPAILDRIIARASTDKAETVRSVEPQVVVSPAPAHEVREEPRQAPRLEPVFDSAPVPAPAMRIEPFVTMPAPQHEHVDVESIAAASITTEPVNAAPAQAAALVADTEISPAVSENVAESVAAAPPDLPAERRKPPQERPAPADDHLADLFEKFAPDSGFLTRGLGAQKPV